MMYGILLVMQRLVLMNPQAKVGYKIEGPCVTNTNFATISVRRF